MKVGVPRETFPQERRVALIPAALKPLIDAKLGVVVESKAGTEAGFSDDAYRQQGAEVVADRQAVFSADIVAQVRGFGANPEGGRGDLERMRSGQVIIGFLEPLSEPQNIREMAERGVLAIAMEMIPRITRAQSMDALSSMATVSGYKAVLLAAAASPRIFPMLMTAAGTVTPARVLVIGAGVAGLQAIATARRLGAVVQGYDIRPAAREQVESLGAKFVELELKAEDSEDGGGYAKAMDEAFYRRQRELLGKVVAGCEVVITTAAVPGKKAPILLTSDMVAGMAPGSVILDLAAERGGNCELTRPDETVVENGVSVLGPTHLAATVPFHASQMYSKNVSNLLLHLVRDGELRLDTEDEIVRESLVSRDGQVVHPRVREALGLAPAELVEEQSGGEDAAAEPDNDADRE